MYEINETYDFGGETRRVTGIDGAGNPITEPADGEPTNSTELGTKAKLDYRGLFALIPMEKCSIAELQSVAEFLGVTLVPTTEGKELTKNEIIAQLGA